MVCFAKNVLSQLANVNFLALAPESGLNHQHAVCLVIKHLLAHWLMLA